MASSSCLASREERFVGDPIDVVTGANVFVDQDFQLPGPLHFIWQRHYDSSRASQRGPLGFGHSHNFDSVLKFDIDGIRYVGPLGREVSFPPFDASRSELVAAEMTLRRIDERRFQLFESGRNALEFVFTESDLLGRLTRVFSGRHAIRLEYGRDRRLTSIIDSVGRQIAVSTNSFGQVTALVLLGTNGSPEKTLLEYEFDEHGNLAKGRDAYRNSFHFAYDQQRRLVRKTDRKGYSFHFEYDRLGRCVYCHGDDGLHSVRLRYLTEERRTIVTKGDGGAWTYYFDEVGSISRIVDPLGGATQFVRDATGKATAEIGPGGVERPRQPLDEGPRAHREPESAAEYEFGRLLDWRNIEIPDPSAARLIRNSEAFYNLIATRISTSDPGASTTTPIAVDPPVLSWWPSPAIHREFDDLGLLVRQRDSQGRTRRWRYDANGNVEQYVDFDGSKWLFERASWNLLVCEEDPIGRKVRYEYDHEERLRAFTDAGGTRSEFERDLVGNVVEVRRHGDLRDRYTRDAAGRLSRKLAADGRLLIAYEYNALGSPVRRLLASGETHEYAYDDLGRYATITSEGDTLEFAYDEAGNRVQEICNGRGVRQEFRGVHSRGQMFWLDRFRIRYETRKDGTTVVTDPSGRKHEVRALGHGILERSYSSGTREFSQFDSAGRCQFKTRRAPSGRAWNRRFHWSGEGELRRTEDNIQGITRYEYDAAHRLSARVRPDGVRESYELDGAGNVLRQPGLANSTFIAGNRLASVEGFSVRYDDRNHLQSRDTTAGEVRYVFNECDQLVRVDSSAGVWEATYDGLGRRTRKTWCGQTTEFFWSGDQLGAEISPNGRLRIYVYADDLALTPIGFVDYESVDAPTDSGRSYCVFSDQVGTPRSIEDVSGNEVWRADVSPYGAAKISPSTKIEFNLRFPGHYWDDEIGLNYNRFRYYDPTLARYIQSDPAGLAGGPNVYAYVANPLERSDVRGLGCWSDEAKQGLIDEGFVILEEKDCNLKVKSPAGHIYDLTPGDPSQPIRFAQIGVSPEFSSKGRFKGAKIDDISAELRAGTRSPDELPVQYIWVNGEKVVVNNRSLTTLSDADKKPTQTTDMTGTLPTEREDPDRLPSVLKRLDEMDGKPSDTMPVRETGTRDSPIARTVSLPK